MCTFIHRYRQHQYQSKIVRFLQNEYDMQQYTCFLCRKSTVYSLRCFVDECHYKKVVFSVFSLKIEKRKRTKKVQLVFPSHSPILLNPLFNAVLWFMKWTSPLLPFTQKRRTTKLQLHYTAIVTHTDYWRLKSPFKIERIEEKIHKEKSSIIFTN